MNLLPEFGSMKGAKLSELCERAAAIYEEHPEAWCKGSFARDDDGYPVSADSPLAKAFCAGGLIGYLQGRITGISHKHGECFSKELPHAVSLISFNDHAKEVGQVVEFLQTAAERFREKGL